MKPLPNTLPLKYRRARELIGLMTSLFITDYRAATIYRVLEAEGYVWNGQAWVREEQS